MKQIHYCAHEPDVFAGGDVGIANNDYFLEVLVLNVSQADVHVRRKAMWLYHLDKPHNGLI